MRGLRSRGILRQSIEKFLRCLRLSQRLDRGLQHQLDVTRPRPTLNAGRTDSLDLGSDGARYIRTIQADGYQPQEGIEALHWMVRTGKLAQVSIDHGFAEGDGRLCRGGHEPQRSFPGKNE